MSIDQSSATRRVRFTRLAANIGSRYVFTTLALIIMGLSGYISIHAAIRMTSVVSNVIDTAKRREGVLTYLSYLKDVERGQRGFLLTGDDAYLQPYVIGRASTVEMMRRMRQNFTDSAWVEVLNDVESMQAAKFDEMAETIRVYREQGQGPAIAIIKTGEGKHLMDQIQMTLLQLNSRESLVVSMDMVKYRSVITEAVYGFAVSNVLVLSLTVVTLLMIESRRRMAIDQAKVKTTLNRQLSELKSIELGETTGEAAIDKLRKLHQNLSELTTSAEMV